jgi:hypothetical protein
MSCLTSTRALVIRHPWLRTSDFGVHAEVLRVFLKGSAFKYHQDKHPAAIPPLNLKLQAALPGNDFCPDPHPRASRALTPRLRTMIQNRQKIMAICFPTRVIYIIIGEKEVLYDAI